MSRIIIIVVVMLLTAGTACRGTTVDQKTDGPSRVRIAENANGFQLYLNDEPYFIKGAGGQDRLDSLVNFGGNSIRTWGHDNAQEILDEAQRHGLTVTVGLWVQHERHGFNYDDEEAVQRQLEVFREVVRKHKDHPALLMWGVGNEMELNASNMKVWDAVNDIAEMIKEEDPNHPTLTAVAEIGPDKIREINNRVPAIDVLGINSYAGLNSIPERVREFGWEKPYVVTEWGPNGHWEVGRTEWNAPLEPTSAEKAALYEGRYDQVIEGDSERCLGSYVFLWGQKQERTPTWYGLFLDTGEKTETADLMAYKWSGKWPSNRTPNVTSITMEGLSGRQNVRVSAGSVGEAKVDAADPDGDDLEFDWYVLKESTSTASGGDAEYRPDQMEGLLITVGDDGSLVFDIPDEPGAYRLFANVLDDNGNGGTANIPFYVD